MNARPSPCRALLTRLAASAWRLRMRRTAPPSRTATGLSSSAATSAGRLRLPRGRPAGLPDRPLRKRVWVGGLP